ncbi:MAG TPA: GNAT family N-acetyltransferase [Candidatus Obscuribacter sp.]|nr:GNAT family N-acetyltransferase [Candidatus Obscuribacter sp.]HNA74857.1 GNAT family N-acetyltransferase [Candidatus Obscuribacter sp.]HNB17601.1 GNAT family N-acetyltransferase [Candidatus Obscuribacter sp.]HND07632.1 GNAT family N-acetyltransferase [Candidatus Obscuribacter sp.]HND65343.1 GNAT family N-acetyltransferase [Candidatus Obscuribacter sp.]
MDRHENNALIAMTLESFDEVPRFCLPGGFTVRTYRSGDERHWLDLQKKADHYNEFDNSTFEMQFGEGIDELSERQLYIEKNGQIIGTATAWSDNKYWEAQSGRIRWVAVLPEYQGMGIGRALISSVLERFALLGETRSYLWTRTVRLPAIKLYLRFGFKPGIRSKEEEEIWARLIKDNNLQSNYSSRSFFEAGK